MTRQNKILILAVALLIIINIAMLVMMLSQRKGNRGGYKGYGDPTEVIAKEVGMTDSQKTEYVKLNEAHFKSLTPKFDSIRALKKARFEAMKAENVNDSTIAGFSTLIAEQQALIDKAAASHFRTVRAMFTGEQQKKYDAFVEKMMQRRMPHGSDKNSDTKEKK